MISVQKDLVRAQLYATEVWKGNEGVIESCLLWGIMEVDGKDGFQERAPTERAQNGSDHNIPFLSRVFQGEVYEIWGSELANGDGELANEKFVERQKVLPDVFRPLSFAFLSDSCPARIDVKLFHG